ncbi:MAG: hypothetical protein K0R47_314 [Brevibacillus sp.]|nr:hypothetical protein [Brevibacillus sp.]
MLNTRAIDGKTRDYYRLSLDRTLTLTGSTAQQSKQAAVNNRLPFSTLMDWIV